MFENKGGQKGKKFRQKKNCVRTDEEKKKKNEKNLTNEEVCETSGETELED